MEEIMERKEGTAGTDCGMPAEKEEVLVFTEYPEFEAVADRTAVKIKEGFMEMGCILKAARDTDILRKSQYTGYEDFAKRRYDMDKGTVSRYIRIVERFSVDGNSNILKDCYRNMGFTKLSIMLHMPDDIAEELMESLSKAEVKAIREEIEAERQISDIELALEKAEVAPVQPEGQEASLLHQAAAQLCKEQQDLFRKLWMEQEALENMQEVLVPLGENVFIVRPPGVGRIMIAIRDKDTSITAVRTGDKEKHSTEEFVAEIWNICRKGMTPEEAFLKEFGEEMETPAAALSGQDPQPAAAVEEKPKQRKVSKVTKARIPKPEPVIEETPAAAVEEQLPGQMEVYDYPEIIPEGMKEESHGTEGKAAAGGEDPTADGEMGSCAGAVNGGQESGDIPEHHESPGTSEDDGCEEDLGDAGLTEEDEWEKVRTALYALKVRFESISGIEETTDIEQVQMMYQKSIDLAAALKKIMMIREREL